MRWAWRTVEQFTVAQSPKKRCHRGRQGRTALLPASSSAWAGGAQQHLPTHIHSVATNRHQHTRASHSRAPRLMQSISHVAAFGHVPALCCCCQASSGRSTTRTPIDWHCDMRHLTTPRSVMPGMSGAFTRAISYRCLRLTAPTVSCPALSAPRASPAACFMYQLLGGPLSNQSYDLSSYTYRQQCVKDTAVCGIGWG